MTDSDQRASSTGAVPATRSVLLGVPRWTRDGGISAHVQSSAAILAGHGLDVRVLTARVESTDEIPGVTVYRCPALFQADAPMAARIGEALAFEPDVVHLHQVDLPDVVQALRASAAVVISAHVYSACPSGLYYFSPGQECTRAHGPGCVYNMVVRGCAHTLNLKSLPTRYVNAGRRAQALQGADLVVSYSSAVDRHLAANGLTRRQIVPFPATIAARSGSGHEHRRRVVFAGRVVRQKGVAVLIRAALEVDGEFIICGDGRQLDAMRRLARRIGVDSRVSFKGWLDSEQLAQEFADASVVVVPSLWPEPFGLVGIEALAAGRPVVASATGGVEDWLDDGVSGLCVTPGDVSELARALNELLADPDRQMRMGLAGKEAVNARFSEGRHVSAILGAYATARASWAECAQALGSSARSSVTSASQSGSSR
ncbi:MAG TPA: glycosyltransferase family 4 protein [Solirubrobacteraceae bacterium]|nr:glycosyltransferase family 4 protein [Solirubrobacteraceae bacterium]